MAVIVEKSALIKAHGNLPKEIHEYIGRVRTQSTQTSIAWMKSPSGWTEPGQTPEFDEYTVVIKGTLLVKTKAETFRVHPEQAIWIKKGEWVQYSTPDAGGAEYIAVCIPAFSPQTVHRD